MDYKNVIGERIINVYDGKSGKIKDVDKNGFIEIEMDGEYPGSYMFDPFIDGILKFERKELQDEIDKIILSIDKKDEELIKRNSTADKNKIKYFITLDNTDGTKEIIYELDSSKDEAYNVMGYVVHKQQLEMRKAMSMGLEFHWRVVRLFDYITKEQICQES